MPLNLKDLRDLKRGAEAAWTQGDSIDSVHNAVNVAELAISEGVSALLLLPVSARKQLNDLPDDLITKVNILRCTDAREALLKAIVE
jgi:ATP-dependent Lon protease